MMNNFIKAWKKNKLEYKVSSYSKKKIPGTKKLIKLLERKRRMYAGYRKPKNRKEEILSSLNKMHLDILKGSGSLFQPTTLIVPNNIYNEFKRYSWR